MKEEKNVLLMESELPITFDKAYEFLNRAYKTYQLDWMSSRSIGLPDLELILRQIIRLDLCEENYTVTADNFDIFADSVKEEFEFSCGFGEGMIYACRDEFLGSEFMNHEYMEHLVRFMEGDEAENLATWEKVVVLFTNYELVATSIEWDTDGEPAYPDTLPDIIEVPDPEWDDETISDYITETTGYCHKGFELKVRHKKAFSGQAF